MWEWNPQRLHGNRTLNRSANLTSSQVKFLLIQKFQSTAAPTNMIYFEFCFSARTCEIRCFTYALDEA